MERFRRRVTVVEAMQLTDEVFDGPHPNNLHIPGVLYDPTSRTASLSKNAVGGLGDWIVREPDGHLYLHLYHRSGPFEGVYEPVPTPATEERNLEA